MQRVVQAPNPQNKMRDHRNYKNRNAENASYIHAQRDAVKPVSMNAPPYSRPMNSSYNKGNVNKEPKPNCCSDKYTSTSYNGSAWQKRIPFSKTYSKTEKMYTGQRDVNTFQWTVGWLEKGGRKHKLPLVCSSKENLGAKATGVEMEPRRNGSK
ncbi:hypothetical protein MM560_G620n2 [Manis javanica]|nr:hypothetical protein MM560_G620n2 [Manis javanica]